MDLTMFILQQWLAKREAQKQQSGHSQLGGILQPGQQPQAPFATNVQASPGTVQPWAGDMPRRPMVGTRLQRILGLPSEARETGLELIKKDKPQIKVSELHKGKKGFFRNVFHDGVLHHTETGLPGPKEKPQSVSMSKPTKRGGTERHTVANVKRGSVMQAQLKEKGYNEGVITGTPKKPVDVPATIGEISKAYAGIAKYKEEGVVDPGLAAIAAKFDIEVDPATQDKESIDKAIVALEMKIEKLIQKLSPADQKELLKRIGTVGKPESGASRFIKSALNR